MTKYWLFWHERLNLIFLFLKKCFGSEKYLELKLSLKSALHFAETAFFEEKYKCLNNSLIVLLYKFDIKATLMTTGTIGCFKSLRQSSMVQYLKCKRLICATHIFCVSKFRVQSLWEKSFIKVSDTHCSDGFLSFLFFLVFFLGRREWYQNRLIHTCIMVWLCYERTKSCGGFHLFTSPTSQSVCTMKAWQYMYSIIIPIRTDEHPSWFQILPDLSQPSLTIAKGMHLLLTEVLSHQVVYILSNYTNTGGYVSTT